MDLPSHRPHTTVLLNEAVHILADEVGLLKTDTRMASRVLPYAADSK